MALITFLYYSIKWNFLSIISSNEIMEITKKKSPRKVWLSQKDIVFKIISIDRKILGA